MGQIEEGNFQKNVILHSIGTPLLWRQVLLVISYQGFFVGTVNYFYCLAIDYSEIPTESIGSIDKTNLLVGAQEREKKTGRVPRKDLFHHSKARNSLPPHQRASRLGHSDSHHS